MAIKTPNQRGPGRLVRTGGLADVTLDQSMRTVYRAIEELQKAGGLVHENVTLADNSETTIAHGLGRAPVFVYVSPPRNALASGSIRETRDTSINRDRFVQIGAYDWGADVVVDVWIIG